MTDSIRTFAGAAVSVAGTGLTIIATISNKDRRILCFHFDTATQSVDDLAVYARAHGSSQLIDFTPGAPASSWTTIPSGSRILRSARSTTATGAIIDGNLKAVTTVQNGYFEMDVSGLAEIVVKASAAADSASVTPNWSLQ